MVSTSAESSRFEYLSLVTPHAIPNPPVLFPSSLLSHLSPPFLRIINMRVEDQWSEKANSPDEEIVKDQSRRKTPGEHSFTVFPFLSLAFRFLKPLLVVFPESFKSFILYIIADPFTKHILCFLIDFSTYLWTETNDFL